MKTIPITKKQLAYTLIIIGIGLSVYTLLFVKPVSTNNDIVLVLASIVISVFSVLGLLFGCIFVGFYINDKLVKDKLRFKK